MKLSIIEQPDGVSCGASCLHSIYHYYTDNITFEQTLKEVPMLKTGGTLAVLMGCHALERGYQATLHSVNLYVLDPTWFTTDCSLLVKLRMQNNRTADEKIRTTTAAYIKFLELGGTIRYNDFSFKTLNNYLDKNIPLISGVSATYLYQNMRDYTSDDNQVVYDEWLGTPTGHFVVVSGYQKHEQLAIADPYAPHTLSNTSYYTIPYSHWLYSHLLGCMTYDAEFVAIYQ